MNPPGECTARRTANRLFSFDTVNDAQEVKERENFSARPVVMHTLHHGSVLIEVVTLYVFTVMKLLGSTESGNDFFVFEKRCIFERSGRKFGLRSMWLRFDFQRHLFLIVRTVSECYR